MKVHRMEGQRFDLMTKVVTSRRSALRAGGLGLAAAATAPIARVAAQESTPAATPESNQSDPHPSADEAGPEPEFLFVQPFDSGTWTPKEGEEGVYTLTLTGADAQTIYFSDRPDRIVGLAPTQQFLDGLGFTPADPPNAALVAQREDETEQDVLVIELLAPDYDAEAGTLTFDARILADYDEAGLAHLVRMQTDYDLDENFGEGSLFIDGCPGHKWDCTLVSDGSFVGTAHVGYCWSTKDLTCKPCHRPYKSCSGTFPDSCVDSDGKHLCNATYAGD